VEKHGAAEMESRDGTSLLPKHQSAPWTPSPVDELLDVINDHPEQATSQRIKAIRGKKARFEVIARRNAGKGGRGRRKNGVTVTTMDIDDTQVADDTARRNNAVDPTLNETATEGNIWE
jgi:hypothetical protein